MSAIANSMNNMSVTDQDKSCTTCGKTDVKISRCANCHFTAYCSTTCQKQDWPRHKTVCEDLTHKGVERSLLKARSKQVRRSDNIMSRCQDPDSFQVQLPYAEKIAILEKHVVNTYENISDKQAQLKTAKKLRDQPHLQKGLKPSALEALEKTIKSTEEFIAFLTSLVEAENSALQLFKQFSPENHTSAQAMQLKRALDKMKEIRASYQESKSD